MPKCPQCGYNFNNKLNYTNLIRNLSKESSKEMKNQVNRIIREMTVYEKVTMQELYFFLYNIKEKEDGVIISQINKFYESKAYQSKPLSYLTKMITSYEEEQKKKLDIDRKIYGRAPLPKEIDE